CAHGRIRIQGELSAHFLESERRGEGCCPAAHGGGSVVESRLERGGRAIRDRAERLERGKAHQRLGVRLQRDDEVGGHRATAAAAALRAAAARSPGVASRPRDSRVRASSSASRPVTGGGGRLGGAGGAIPASRKSASLRFCASRKAITSPRSSLMNAASEPSP